MWHMRLEIGVDSAIEKQEKNPKKTVEKANNPEKAGKKLTLEEQYRQYLQSQGLDRG